jgi:hypothetical protein
MTTIVRTLGIGRCSLLGALAFPMAMPYFVTKHVERLRRTYHADGQRATTREFVMSGGCRWIE